MAEIALAATPPFAIAPGRYGRAVQAPGLRARPIEGRALVQVMARRGREAELADAVRDRFGAALPDTPLLASGREVSFLWAGRRQWLAIADESAVPDLDARLRQTLTGMASLSDQSDARCIVALSGTNVRDTLAKLTPIDLHPRAFRPARTGLTLFGHLGGQITQIDETPAYEVMVFRGFAESLWSAILAAGAEFGVEIESAHAL